MRKDPSEFKKLGKLEWRRIEQPTFAMRMRAMCNQVKKCLLAGSHDPFSIQTAAIIRTGKAPTDDEATWKRWWTGMAIPQATHLNKFEEIVPGASRWLELTELGSPLQRHMQSLDAAAIELSRDGEWWLPKHDAQTRSLKSLKKIWSIYTKLAMEPKNSPLWIENQTGKTLQPPSFRHASPQEKLRAAIFEINPYRYEFPEATRDAYVDSEKFGLQRFFLSLLQESGLDAPCPGDLWILDMATLTALMRTETVSTPEHEAPGLGNLTSQYAFWNRLFWDHIQGTITPLIDFATTQAGSQRKDQLELALDIRKRYYAILREAGIQFRDVYQLMCPVKVMGSNNLFQNVIILENDDAPSWVLQSRTGAALAVKLP